MRTPHWEPLDDRPALDWLAATTGPAAARELWAPLLRAKFGPAADTVPAAWMWGRFEQRKAARDRGGEKLGYLRGGFRQLFDALHDELTAAGVEVRTGVRVSSLDLQEDRVRGVVTDTGAVPADVVLFTGGMPGLFGLVPERHHDSRWNPRGLGVLCVVVEASRPATDVYWTNVCDPRLPFGGLIEHTNLLPAADYGGRHVFYLSRYFTHEEPVAQADPHDEARRWLAALAQRYPAFDPATVLAVHPFRTPYAAPLVDLGYGRRMAPFRTSLDGLFVCTTAQIYPHDRGMNEGIVMGSRVVDEILGRSGGHR
jgi:protoporphyrinogen oxidase